MYPVITGATQLEMKRKHILQGRHREPSLAGLFLGANALISKPVATILPITASRVLERDDDGRGDVGGSDDVAAAADDASKRRRLFYLLVVPPLVCSCLQLLAWSRYDLTPKRTARMCDELKKLRKSDALSTALGM